LKLGCRGGVTPTLNAFDNANENRATVLIIDGTRVGDVRVYEDQVMQTVIQRWGTGGGNVPAIAFDTQFGSNANTFEDISPTLKASQQPPSFSESSVVRRLTPTECERLQGFPDGWTAEQADSNRYKQMGNAVAVPVVQWIINNVVGE
jgi:DNA (cytosine-5)-methyltransferase 1